jgi:hypothetical protein
MTSPPRTTARRATGTNAPPVLDPPIALSAAPGEMFTFNGPGFNDPDGELAEFFLVDAQGNLVRQMGGLTAGFTGGTRHATSGGDFMLVGVG